MNPPPAWGGFVCGRLSLNCDGTRSHNTVPLYGNRGLHHDITLHAACAAVCVWRFVFALVSAATATRRRRTPIARSLSVAHTHAKSALSSACQAVQAQYRPYMPLHPHPPNHSLLERRGRGSALTMCVSPSVERAARAPRRVRGSVMRTAPPLPPLRIFSLMIAAATRLLVSPRAPAGGGGTCLAPYTPPSV